MINDNDTRTERMKMAIQDAVEEALNAINHFGSVLVRETQALKEVDHDKVGTLQDEKVSAAAAYHEWIMTLTDRKEEMRGLPKSQKDRLSDAYKHFAKVTDDNRRTLVRSQEVASRIEKIIIKAAKKSVKDAPNYDGNAFYGMKSDRPINFKINQTL